MISSLIWCSGVIWKGNLALAIQNFASHSSHNSSHKSFFHKSFFHKSFNNSSHNRSRYISVINCAPDKDFIRKFCFMFLPKIVSAILYVVHIKRTISFHFRIKVKYAIYNNVLSAGKVHPPQFTAVSWYMKKCI